MSKLLFRQVLDNYGNNVGLNEIQYDDIYGTCLKFDRSIELFLRWNDRHNFVLASILCGNPKKENREKLFLNMLHANYFWSETGGATLSYNEELDAIFLIDKWGIKAVESTGKLSHKIDQLVNASFQWKALIESCTEPGNSQHTYIDNKSYRHTPDSETL